MNDQKETEQPIQKITLSGVTFAPEQIISAVVKIDGREIIISKKEDDVKRLGF